MRRADRDDNNNRPGEDLTTYKLVRPGDLVLNKMKTWQGSLGVSQYTGIVSPAYFVCEVSSQFDHRYLHHLLRSATYIAMYEARSKGIRPNQWDLPYDELRQIPVVCPSLDEQRRIADFLDDRVSRIDRIIAARRKQTQLVSDRAKGELQRVFDSTVQSVGAIRVGLVLRRMEQGWSPQADSTPAEPGEWGVMRAGCVNGGQFQEGDNKRLPDGLEPVIGYEIHAGDLIMSRASGSLDLIGSVAVVPRDVRSKLILCDKLYRLNLEPAWGADFIAAMLRSLSNRGMIRNGVSGAEGMANNLPSRIIRDLTVPAAPEALQRQVVRETNKIESDSIALMSHLTRSTDLLSEYKSSLITAAVTGELDVTTASSTIPE